jgi:hypothetical protein
MLMLMFNLNTATLSLVTVPGATTKAFYRVGLSSSYSS